MRELHVVAMSEDGRHVVLATRKGAATGDFRVAIDDRLSAAVKGDLPRPGEEQPAVVTPKEIQARLRAGESTEEIAASAGVPVAKIERYAGPVLSERERVLDQARAGFVSRSRLGASALPLGEAVDRHLADTVGVRLETVEWSARREDTGSWLVELSYVSQARRRSAIWRYDVARREVTATDSASAALAHVEEGGRRSRAPEHESVTVHVPARRRQASPPRPARQAAPKAPATPKAPSVPAARTVAARPTPPVRVAAPVPTAAAPARAAQTAADKAAAASAARAETQRAAAQERAARAAAEEAARREAAAVAAAALEARAAEQRAADLAAQRKAKAEAARKAKAAEERKAKAEAARKAKAAAEKKAKAEAARKAKAAAEKKAKADAARKAKEAEAARKEAEAEAAKAARAAEEAPPGPPTLRVVGSDDDPAPKRREPKEPPAAARTAPARVAGQRASVPGWADVLLSTAPVARSESDDD